MLKNIENPIQISEKEYNKFIGLEQKVSKLKKKIEQKDEWIKILLQELYGKKSEKTPKQDIVTVEYNQLTILEAMDGYRTDEIENISPEEKSKEDIPIKENSKEDNKKSPGRRKVAINLPECELILKVPKEYQKDKNGESLVLIGYECSERLHRVPEKLERLIVKREVWGYKDSRDRVIVAAPLSAIIPKGKLTDELIHHIVFEKFFNGMPLYRQLKSLNALGADLSKSTMSDAVKRWAKLYNPVVGAIKKQVLSSKYVHADESPLKYKSTEKKKYKNGYVFVYQDTEQAYFYFGESRAQKMISNILGSVSDSGKYLGYLMCDGYAGYNVHSGKRLACWAHVRRQFFKLASGDSNAKHILKLINKLYKIERSISKEKNEKNWSEKEYFEKLFNVRNIEAKKIIKQLEEALFLYANKCSPSSSMGKAISYTKNRWKELQVYLEDGCLPIDNNAAERSIRSMVVGRKNFLFVGSEAAGEWATDCYSIMESCRLQGLDPRDYMRAITPILLENRDNQDFDYTKLTPKSVCETVRNIRKMQKNL